MKKLNFAKNKYVKILSFSITVCILAVATGGVLSLLMRNSIIVNATTNNDNETYSTSTSGYIYKSNGEVLTITGYKGEGGNIEIPSKINEKLVTAIGENAFSYNKTIKKVCIPNTIRNIGNNAFYGCSITYVYISESVIGIGTGAFSNCKNLTNITVNEENSAFSSDDGVLYSKSNNIEANKNKVYRIIAVPSGKSGNFKIHNSVTQIWDSAFLGCSKLISIEIPNTVKSIGNKAFYGCEKAILTFNNISSITNFGTEAFWGVPGMSTGLSLNKTSMTMGLGESYILKTTIFPSGTKYKYIKWTSSNNSIAIVDSNGKITTKKTGTTKITAQTINGNQAICTIIVKKAPTSISLNKSSLLMGIGSNFDLNASLPSGTASYNIIYNSNNKNVAEVTSAGGIVSAKGTGTAVITATTYNGKKVSCTVKVNMAETEVADPYIMYDNDTQYYYLYKTGFVLKNSVLKSKDLNNWQIAKDYVTYTNARIKILKDTNGNNIKYNKKIVYTRSNFWAPEVYKYNNQYYMVYSSRNLLNEDKVKSSANINNGVSKVSPDYKYCISIAKSSSPLGPFKDIVTFKNINITAESSGQIDGHIFFDKTNKSTRIYLYFVNTNDIITDGNILVRGNSIYGVELDTNLIKTKGNIVKLVTPDRSWEHIKYHYVNEAPQIIKSNGKYYLMYSANDTSENEYSLGYAVSTSPLGKYKKIGNGTDNRFLSMNKKTKLFGPGHNCIFKASNGQLKTAYHYLKKNKNTDTNIDRRLKISNLGFDKKGKPYVY